MLLGLKYCLSVAFPCVFSPDTAALLKQEKDLLRKIHKVDIDVKDLQSNGGIQTVSVRICQCRNGVCLEKDSSVSMGSMAWLAMLLPLALLLLLCEFHPGVLVAAALWTPEQTQPDKIFQLLAQLNALLPVIRSSFGFHL